MTLEIKMEIIKVDEDSKTNISWLSFGQRLAWVTSNGITLHDRKMRHLVAKKVIGTLKQTEMEDA